jgi:hypothetical protein
VPVGGASVIAKTGPSVLDSWQTLHLDGEPKNVFRGSNVAFCGVKGKSYSFISDLEPEAVNQKGEEIKKVPGFKPTVSTSVF